MSSKNKKARSRSARANLNFSVGGIESAIRKDTPGTKYQKEVFVFVAGALQHIANEILTASGGENSSTRIQPRTIRAGLNFSSDYGKIFSRLQISGTAFGGQ